ncbi:hypothetical protein BKH43_07935 [Helicobacter sp. 13S00401-1]|uniref:DNA adenine methylase n=1 Tax=Helicobacter sp. 13S00401-1 TaxID=1905758 RepID=UPI000BA56ACB|nr:DNA adenine methylase [Helicobacter sp. 13S00401-1]PAF48341.1 hypothetical protein BKH43_07935 [Helicobacter sp. 13S00401-1]
MSDLFSSNPPFLMPTTLKAPFGWVGGKSKLAKDVIKLMPPHQIYVEVFAGALSVFYAKGTPKSNPILTGGGGVNPPLKQDKYSEIVNDINSDLINLHTVIKTRPRAFKAKLDSMLCSREIFEGIKKGLIRPKDSLEKAVYYYYLIVFSFASKGGHFALNKARKPKSIYKDYSVWSERLKSVTIENMDFKALIPKYDTTTTFFYADPPYVGTENYYKTKTSFTKEEHIALANLLKNIKGKFLLSYNDHSLVRELYVGFNIIESKNIRYTLNMQANKYTSELFILNYNL